MNSPPPPPSLPTVSVGGVQVLDISSFSQGNSFALRPTNRTALHWINLLYTTSRSNTNPAIRPIQNMAAIIKAKATFRRTAMFALAELGRVIEVWNTIPKGLAKWLINRRILALIAGFLKIINIHQEYIDGARVWSNLEARKAVFIMTTVQRGFNYLLQTAELVAETPVDKLEALGERLHEKYLEKCGDMF